jgi:hypothetical protein
VRVAVPQIQKHGDRSRCQVRARADLA